MNKETEKTAIEKKALDIYPDHHTKDGQRISMRSSRKIFIEGYLQAIQDVKEALEKRIKENSDNAVIYCSSAFAGRTAEDNELRNIINNLTK